MKGFGTNEKELIRILSKPDPVIIATIRTQYNQRFMKNLINDLASETSGYFKQGLLAIARGPLTQDAHQLHDAVKGLGTKESVLNDVLLGRSNADINAIKAEYQHLFQRSLEADLRADLSAATEQMFVMVVSARRADDSAPVLPHQVDADVADLQRAIGSAVTKDPVHVAQILTSRSDAQLRAIALAYHQKFAKPLAAVIRGRFSGHMEDALLLVLARAVNRADSDAELLEAAMAGMGTKDELLVNRVVRIHWDRRYLQQVKAAYKGRYHRDLATRIKGETRGDYERLMLACIE